MPLRVGLTGGIASGKSTAAERFAELGVEVIDADRIARELVEPGAPLLSQVRQTFGEVVVDDSGRLDRRRLRHLVFSDDDARKRLEALLHPAIEHELERRAAAARTPYVVLVVPLLAEKGWDRLVDRVLVIDLPEAEQLRRLCQRDRISADEARRMMAAQAGRAERRALADDLIVNTGSRKALRDAVDRLHQRYLALAEQAH